MAEASTAKLGKDWQYYVTAVGLLRSGYWAQQLPASCLPALQQHLSSFDAWSRFFGLDHLEAADGRRTDQSRSSSKTRKPRGSTSKTRGGDSSTRQQEQDSKASKAAGAKSEATAAQTGASDGPDIPPPSELTEFLESDKSILQERKELLGEEGMLSMRVRVLLFDVLMHNALYQPQPRLLLAKQTAMSVAGPHKGNASAGGGATGIVYNETPGPGEEGVARPEQSEQLKREEELQKKRQAQAEEVAKRARLAQAPHLDFSSAERLAATADPLLRYGMREYYRLEDMFYTLEYDAEDFAFEHERHKGIPRGVLPDVPLPKAEHEQASEPAADTSTEASSAPEAADASAAEAPGATPAPETPAAPATPAPAPAAPPAPAAAPAPATAPAEATSSGKATPQTGEQAAKPDGAPTSSRFLAGSSLGESMEDVPTSSGNNSPDGSPGSQDGSPRGASSSRELRNLLSDVKPHKPWSGSPIDGQEELCAALEEVMVALKNYTKHSYPFLTRVRKCDAPDYYEIIKEPMDLGKMHKKLKRLDYFSKQEFIDDLDLMFDNCKRYNTDPKSIYRVHAKMLDKKAKTLLRKVRDIDITGQKGAIEDTQQKPRRGRPPRANPPGSAPAGPGRPRGRPGRPRKHSLEPREESQSPVMTPMAPVKRGRPGRPRKHPYPGDESPARSQSPATPKRKRGRPGRPRKVRPEDLYQEPEYMLAQLLQITEPDDHTTTELVKQYFAGLDAEQRLDFFNEDPQVRLWRVRTLASRLRAAREREICEDLPFAEHRELRRTPKDMFQFVCNYASHCDELAVDGSSGHYDDEACCDVEAFEGTEEAEFMEKRPAFSTSNLPQVIDITIESTKKKRGRGRISNVERQKIQEEQEIKRAMAMRAPMDKATCEGYFMPEALPLCAVPDMPQPLPPVAAQPPAYPFATGVDSAMSANLGTLRTIHRLREEPQPVDVDGDVAMADGNAAAAAQAPAAPTQAAQGPAKAAQVPAGPVQTDVRPEAFLERAFLAHRSPEASRVMLTKAVAVAVEHAGFQAAQSSALEVLTDGCMRYMERFAAALQAHQIVFCNKAQPEALLTRALFEMGVDGVQGLREHMESGVEQRGQRLRQAAQLCAQHSKLPPAEVAQLSCPKKEEAPVKAQPSGLGSTPPALCLQPDIPRAFQARPRPSVTRAMLAVKKGEADEEGEEEADEEPDDDVEMGEADETGGEEEADGEEDGEEEEEEENQDDVDEDADDNGEEEEEEPKRKVTRSSRSSTLGKRTAPETRTTRTTRSRQEPSPKTPKTRSGAAVTPPQRRRARPQRSRNT